jgi:hypothetical protein
MLEFLDNEYTGDGEDAELGDALQSEALGEDLEAIFGAEDETAEHISFVDPGLLIALATLKKEDVITRDEAREALGLPTGD